MRTPARALCFSHQARSLRKFNARTLGAKRPTATATSTGVQRHSLVPGCAPAAQIVLDDAEELDPLQWEGGFMEKRASLIEHFNIAWNTNRVAWLPFPGTGQSSACTCYCILQFTHYSCACAWFRHRCLTAAQHSTAQHSTAQHSTAQHSTAQHSTAQHSSAIKAAAHAGTGTTRS
jgi:hypothetical protein